MNNTQHLKIIACIDLLIDESMTILQTTIYLIIIQGIIDIWRWFGFPGCGLTSCDAERKIC